MNVVKFASPRQRLLESLRKAMPRLLRTYESMAREYHDCWLCDNLICPGELYFGKVYITPFTSGKRIVVAKEHSYNCEPEPDYDGDRIMRDYLDDLDNSVRGSEDLALTA